MIEVVLDAMMWLIFSSTGPVAGVWLLWQFVMSTIRPRLSVLWAVVEFSWWLGQRWLIATRLDAKVGTLKAGSMKRSLSRKSVHKLVVEELSTDRNRGRELVSGWFFNKSYDQLRRKDLLRWWCWVEANSCSIDITENKEELLSNVKKIEKVLGPLAPDDSPQDASREKDEAFAQCARLNIDSVRARALAKPLWLYLILRGGSVVLAFMLMKALGFERVRVGSMAYWLYRSPHTPKAPPVLFLHGLGIGIPPYIAMIYQLFKDAKKRQSQGFVIPDLWYIAMASPPEVVLRGGIPDCMAHLDLIRHALNALDATSFDIFSHSYGSIIAAWMAKYESKTVHNLALADPVSILLHYSRVCRKFLYEIQPTGNSISKPIIRRAISLDACVVHVMMRNFWWQENTLFCSDIAALDRPPLVILSECDEYCPSPLIRDRLKEKPSIAKVLFFPSACHGQVVMSQKLRRASLAEFFALVASDKTGCSEKDK